VTQGGVPAIEIVGEWFRCVSLHRDPLSFEGARLMGGRLNSVGEPALYLAQTPTLAVAENLRLGSLFGIDRFPPRLLVTVEVTLKRVVDLREAATCALLGVSQHELSAEWRLATALSRTQRLGTQLGEMGFEGVLVPSTLEPTSANLAVLVRNIELADCVKVVGAD